jgi:hypothetical protein
MPQIWDSLEPDQRAAVRALAERASRESIPPEEFEEAAKKIGLSIERLSEMFQEIGDHVTEAVKSIVEFSEFAKKPNIPDFPSTSNFSHRGKKAPLRGIGKVR